MNNFGIIEALLFASSNALKIEDIKNNLNISSNDWELIFQALKQKYDQENGCGICLKIFNEKIQFCTNDNYATFVEKFLNPIKEKELSKAAIETLIIIAYKQPVTKLEVEQIRGINCEYVFSILQNFNLIKVCGKKDSLGKPNLYKTTEEFLKKFNLNKLCDLPKYKETIKILKQFNTTEDSQELFEDINQDIM